MKTLVGNWSRVDLNVRVRKAASKLLKRGMLLAGSHEHQNARVAGDNAEQRRTKLLKDIVNGGDDDGNVVSRESRVGGNRLGFVDPVADAVDEEAGVSMKPAKEG